MDTINKLEINKKFVEFLGWKVTGTDVEIPTHLYKPTSVKEIESGRYYFTMDMLDLDFQNDFSFMMELVSKIENNSDVTVFDITKESITVEYYPKVVDDLYNVTCSYVKRNMTKIEALSQICLSYILWFNNKVKPYIK